jgi:hypothetical protein
MDLSPMNLQVVIPKTTEVSQMQHKIDHEVNMQQDMGTLKLQEDAELKQKQVRTRDKMEDGKIKDDSQNKNQSQMSGKQEQDEKEEEPSDVPMAVDSIRGHNIDIKL